MTHFKTKFAIIFACLFTLRAFADASPVTGTWKGGHTPELTVKVFPVKNRVEVLINKDKDQIPESIGITFFNADGKATRLKLKTIDPITDSVSNPVHYVGLISQGPEIKSQSFVGFQIEIPFNPSFTKIIKSTDLKRFFQKKE